MVTTEINILEQIQISEELIESIKSAAKEDSLKKLNTILYDVYENDLKFSFEIICRVKISKK